MKCKDADLWFKAVQTELDLLKENNTWTIVDNLPDGEKAISTKWAFKVKKSKVEICFSKLG